MREKYVKPLIKPGDGDFVFEAMKKQVEEYRKTGMINGRKVPVKSNISCRQCSACHGCR
jgi:threonine dehydrogenase-like Zn-dependent dehydrogenase